MTEDAKYALERDYAKPDGGNETEVHYSSRGHFGKTACGLRIHAEGIGSLKWWGNKSRVTCEECRQKLGLTQ